MYFVVVCICAVGENEGAAPSTSRATDKRGSLVSGYFASPGWLVNIYDSTLFSHSKSLRLAREVDLRGEPAVQT